jgi:hypothetical protein
MKTVVSLALAFVLLLFVKGIFVSRFQEEQGRREFYLRSVSSQSLIKEKLSLFDLFFVKGESVSFACANEEETLACLLARYNACVLFEEEAGGTRSYYCVSEEWADGVLLNGVFVNLHIAFNGEACALGAYVHCYLYDRTGYCVAQKQLEIPVMRQKKHIGSSPAQATQDDHFIVFKGEHFCYTFSKNTGSFISLVKNGEEQLIAPIRITAMRAPIDNERRMKQNWY